MSTEDLTALAGDIRQRLDAIGQKISDDALEERITAAIDKAAAAENGPFTRRALFGGDSRLQGSKFGQQGWSVADIEFLHGLMTAAGKRISPDLDGAFTALSEGRYQDVVTAKAADLNHVERMFADGKIDRPGFQQAVAAIDQTYSRSRAMDTAESGYGSQLIGAGYIGELWAGARARSRLFGLLPTFEMTHPTEYLPVEAALPELYYVAENTAADASQYTTTKTGSNRVTVSAKKFVIHQMWSGEMEEDSIVPFVPFLRGQQVRSLAHYSDSLALNGDTTNASTLNINSYDADPADTKHYLAFDGIRHAALVDNTGNASSAAGSLSYTKLLALRGLMVDTTYLHDWGHPDDPGDLIYAVDPAGADDCCDLDEVITVDKYGPQAVVLTGEVANIGRHPLIGSIAIAKTNNDGMVKASGNDYSQVVCFNRRAFIVGIRRSLKIETEREAKTDQTRIVLSTRMGFGRFSPTGAASGIEGAAVLYYI